MDGFIGKNETLEQTIPNGSHTHRVPVLPRPAFRFTAATHNTEKMRESDELHPLDNASRGAVDPASASSSAADQEDSQQQHECPPGPPPAHTQTQHTSAGAREEMQCKTHLGSIHAIKEWVCVEIAGVSPCSQVRLERRPNCYVRRRHPSSRLLSRTGGTLFASDRLAPKTSLCFRGACDLSNACFVPRPG